MSNINKISDLKRLGECKSALDIGFKFSLYDDDGNGVLNGYNIDIYYSKLNNEYIYLETTIDDEISFSIVNKLFGDFVEDVLKHLEI